jgi:pilus assembly protein CpaB
MKWSTLALVLVGIVAAICAAILVAGLRAKPADSGEQEAGAPPTEVSVVIAAKTLDAMTVVSADAIIVRKVPVKNAPAGYLSDPAQVVGKVLGARIVAGQPFTKSRFATEGSGQNLASALPQGKRAVAISLTDYSGLEGLLYPGGVVDILASFREPSSQSEAVSTMLLERVQILAVENRTVFTSKEDEVLADSPGNRKRRVTVVVDPEQAQALQLAMEYGTISLALRNPTDDAAVRPAPTHLRNLSVAMAKRPRPKPPAPAKTPAAPAKTGDPAPPKPAPPETVPDETEPPAKTWETEIIRGSTRETETFPSSEEEGTGESPSK